MNGRLNPNGIGVSGISFIVYLFYLSDNLFVVKHLFSIEYVVDYEVDHIGFKVKQFKVLCLLCQELTHLYSVFYILP